MAIFAGKFVFGKAFELQSRVFLKPCGKTKIIVRCCSNFGESSMDFPVRYTPKRSSNFNKPNDPTPTPKSSDEFESRRFANDDSSNDWERSRVGLSMDEKSPDFKSGNLRSKEKKTRNSAVRLEVRGHNYKWQSAVSNSVEELHEFDAMEGLDDALDELDSENGEYEIKHLALEPSKSKEEAEKIAIRLLAARACTALELKKKLSGKKFSPDVVNAVISDFQNRGLINDFLYAEAFSRSRWSSSSWGPHRIKQALAKKGVNDIDAQKAIKLVLEDGESVDDDQVSRFGLSKPSIDHLFAQASKQWIRAKDLPSEKQKSRIITWLQYRGFNWGIINFILKKLQSEHPP
ncbi:hypothetical protein L1987_19791 [Smallanthus sonchifolius]|uniref:Uncharacterized protein n=1 Tax=Smallanthus sonchifolius TaxID=185202 RepID=A0ACB9IRV4_9ASTR|nr:hypothetical protein L1987_19791 [Smallanthus sonchifolius]